jgi:hypothetical protein
MSYVTRLQPSAAGLATAAAPEVRDLLSRSVARWATGDISQELAAEWYQTSQNLCRKGIPIDQVLHFVERATEDMPVCEKRPSSWAQFRSYVRYYVVRGYQDAIR